MRIDVFEVEKNTKRYLWPIIGAALVIIGFVLIFEYIIHFIKIFVGLILISGGLYLILKQKFIRDFTFFKF